MTSLVKQIDSLVGSAADRKAPNKAFFVLITDDPDAATSQLESLAQKEAIRNIPLTVFDGVSGPRGYNIAKDAEVTIMMWKKGTVQVNRSFRKGALDENAVEQILAEAKRFVD